MVRNRDIELYSMSKFLETIAELSAGVLADWRTVRVAAPIIVAAVACVASAQTPAQQVPPAATPPAAGATDFQESQLYGCWKHAGVRPVANQWTGDAILCFRKDRTVHYNYIAPERGEADLFEWRLLPDDTLSIDEQSCDMQGTTAETLSLGRCLYMGGWDRQCARMNDEGTGCPGDPARTATRQAPPSATAKSDQPPAYSHESQFYGCWKHTALPSPAIRNAGYSTLCFRNDRTVYYGYISSESGGDHLFKWRFAPNDRLIIDGQSCRIKPGNNAKNLVLERCVYMGAWVQQCARLNSDGTGCSRDQ
jgi:hypothetical protein